jgi:hypothetical protein
VHSSLSVSYFADLVMSPQALVLVNSLPQTFGLDYTMPTFNPLNSSSTNGISKLLSRLPGTHLANASSDYYHRYMDSLFHPLHVPIFKARAQLLQSQVYSQEYNKIDISFVATYLAVCAIGTQTMGEVGGSSAMAAVIETKGVIPCRNMQLAKALHRGAAEHCPKSGYASH